MNIWKSSEAMRTLLLISFVVLCGLTLVNACGAILWSMIVGGEIAKTWNEFAVANILVTLCGGVVFMVTNLCICVGGSTDPDDWW